MNTPPLIILLVVVAIAIFAIRQYFHQRRENANNDAAPQRDVMVEVTAKRDWLSPNRRSRQRKKIPVEERKYEAYFKPLNGGAQIKLTLEPQAYDQLAKGQQGVLSVKGKRFIAFRPQDAAQKP